MTTEATEMENQLSEHHKLVDRFEIYVYLIIINDS